MGAHRPFAKSLEHMSRNMILRLPPIPAKMFMTSSVDRAVGFELIVPNAVSNVAKFVFPLHPGQLLHQLHATAGQPPDERDFRNLIPSNYSSKETQIDQ
jgi:hypothetical protein